MWSATVCVSASSVFTSKQLRVSHSFLCLDYFPFLTFLAGLRPMYSCGQQLNILLFSLSDSAVASVTLVSLYQSGACIPPFLFLTPFPFHFPVCDQTTPNVLLWSAAAAACAQPGMYEPVVLMAKNVDDRVVPLLATAGGAHSWSSKTVHWALPMARLSELFNVNHFIVSQVNPHVVPFLRSLKSNSRFSVLHRLAMVVGSEVIHRLKQLAELGYWPRCVVRMPPPMS